MRRERRIFTILVAVVAALGGTTTGASVALGDIGTEDFSYAPLGGSPTQTKPESKLWFNDGSWWASMFAPATGAHRIHRLGGLAGPWTDTGTTLDERDDANADVLWHAASNKLYVASHPFTENSRAAAPGEEGRLYRYSYDPASDAYSPDAGFPVAINGAKSESLVIDMDSRGRLWATWTQDRRVYVNHTDGNDASWGTPFLVPGSTALSGTNDDLSSVVAFGGDRIGVMWSNQADGRFWFASHADGADDAAWSTAPISGLPLADDHISLRADATGRVFAALKTSQSTGPETLTLLLRRNVNGTWNNVRFGTVSDSHTRPIVVLQEPGNRARMYATCPHAPLFTSGQSGGDICEKTTSTGSLSFTGGPGPAVIRDEDSPEMNDVTSTKQSVNGTTGLVIMANNDADLISRYWHRFISISTAAPAAVVAAFSTAPTSGDAPLPVQFGDASTGGPRSWSWNFGDGTTSSARNPVHVYTFPGTYSVSLTVASTSGRNTQTKAGLITVTGSPPPTPGSGTAGVSQAGGGTAGGAVLSGGGVSTPGTGATTRRVRITLFKRNLSGRRVRLSGSVTPRLNGVRVTLQRRSSTGRWSSLRTARLLRYTRTRSRFVFVVKRLSRTVGYRILLPAAGGRARTLTAALTVKRRR